MIKRQDVQFDNEELIKNVKHNIKTETKKYILKTRASRKSTNNPSKNVAFDRKEIKNISKY